MIMNPNKFENDPFWTMIIGLDIYHPFLMLPDIMMCYVTYVSLLFVSPPLSISYTYMCFMSKEERCIKNFLPIMNIYVPKNFVT